MDSSAEKVARLRNLSTLRQSRQIHFLRAAFVGIFAAAIAIAFQCSIEGVAGFVNSFSGFSDSSTGNGLLLVIFCGVSGLVGGYFTQCYAPEAGGSGIPHVKAVLLHLRELRFSRLLPVKFIAGALAIGGGFSLGREGPTVHIGAAVADGIGKLLKVPSRSRNHLIACGAGAGLAAAFNAPLAGFLFVIEELRKELSPITYGAAFIAAVIADGVVRGVLGPMPSLSLSIYSSPALTTLPTIFVVALIAGGAGVLFNRTLLLGVAHISPRLSVWRRGLIVGIFIGIVSLLIPYARLGLQGTIDQFLQSRSSVSIAMWTFGGYFLLKYILTVVSYLSGLPGGIFAPMLAQGALLGVFAGRLCSSLAIFPTLPDGIYGIVGMAAFFSASVRAPLTGVVLIADDQARAADSVAHDETGAAHQIADLTHQVSGDDVDDLDA